MERGGGQQMKIKTCRIRRQLAFKLFVCGSRRGGGYIGYISKMHLKIHTGKASPSFPRKTKLYGPYLIKILGLSYCLLLSFDKQKTRAFEMNRLIFFLLTARLPSDPHENKSGSDDPEFIFFFRGGGDVCTRIFIVKCLHCKIHKIYAQKGFAHS